ncbi:MAG TPA: hypothetical protein VFV33_20150 [Gemmatimonadaceae bacterium]|nr:hypothetical protein [Gemmatimonadaceae bacterium]
MRPSLTILRSPSLALGALLVLLAGCGHESATDPKSPAAVDPFGDPPWDLAANGIPRFVGVDYIELGKIGRISKFRSGIGHDASDDFESCRSMKHYYEPKATVDWASVRISSPIDGKVLFIYDGTLGPKITIKSTRYPAFFVSLFHVRLASPLKEGDAVAAGQFLGTHFGSQTYSDIEVGVHTTVDGPNGVSPPGWKAISYFDVMTDELFQGYRARGMVQRSDAIIPKEARDASPLSCTGTTFAAPGTVENWVRLN